MKDIDEPQAKSSALDPVPGRVGCISKRGFHQIAYREWGEPTADQHVLCVHGLTRNGHDFDPLAKRLAKTRHVVTPDLVGRGQSDWLSDPEAYNIPQYNLDMTVVAARTRMNEFTWIGTSLGGLMGMVMAGIKNSPIRRLVINDVGPNIPFAALTRLTSYLGARTVFPDLDQVETHLRGTLAPFGPMKDADWKRMAKTSSIHTELGYVMHHDPDIMHNFNKHWVFMHFSLWKYWEKIECPVLILRGTESDFLTELLLTKMLETLPHAEAVEFEGVGHTPTLNAASQIDPIVEWLDRT